jgi:cellulase/cellobiase CelA1
MPPPDPTVQSVDDIGADDTSWLAGYTSTTTQDCCKPSCAWQDLVAGKGLDVAQPWNAIYSCDQGGDPITGLGWAGGVCPPGFDGPDCDNNIDDCAQEACQNGGTCVDAINGYTCECPPDWGGADCAMPCPGGECTGLTLQLIEDSVWDEGFTAYLRLTNQGPDTLDGWTVTCQFDFEVTGAWNALWTTDGENHTFTHEEWNAVLLPDNTLDIGMDCMGSLGLDSVLGCTLNGEAMVVPVIKNPG